jgi:hypothetical protein
LQKYLTRKKKPQPREKLGGKKEFLRFAWKGDSTSEIVDRTRPRMSRTKTAWMVASGFTAFIAGALIINSGFHTQSVMLSALTNPTLQQSLPEIAQLTLRFGSLILGAIVGLGGILALLGGGLVLLRHFTLGKILISLGGGFGLFGIGLALIYAIVSSGGFSIVFLHIEYWIGLAIATVARAMAGKAQRA